MDEEKERNHTKVSLFWLSGYIQQPLSRFAFGRALILRRLTPSVERLCSAADAAGDKIPANPKPISVPLNPITNR